MSTERSREKSWLAVALAWVGGFVDAVGYITLYRLFTAHMSGNSVGLGVDVARGHWLSALHRVTPILAYVPAVAVGATVIEVSSRCRLRFSAAMVLSLEAAALLAAVVVGSGRLAGIRVDTATGGVFYLLAALLAGAMGLQSATLRRVGGGTVRTNFVTGILTNLAENAVVGLFAQPGRRAAAGGPAGDIRAGDRGAGDRGAGARGAGEGTGGEGTGGEGTGGEGTGGEGTGRVRSAAFRRVVLLGGIWLAYMVGAVVGGVLDQHWQLRALALPLAVLAGVIAVDLVAPFRPSLPDPGAGG